MRFSADDRSYTDYGENEYKYLNITQECSRTFLEKKGYIPHADAEL